MATWLTLIQATRGFVEFLLRMPRTAAVKSAAWQSNQNNQCLWTEHRLFKTCSPSPVATSINDEIASALEQQSLAVLAARQAAWRAFMPLSVPMFICHPETYTFLALSDLGSGQRLVGLPTTQNCNTPPTAQAAIDAATFTATEAGHLAITLTHTQSGQILRAQQYNGESDGFLSLVTVSPADASHIFNVTTLDADQKMVSFHSTYLEASRPSYIIDNYPIRLTMTDVVFGVTREGMLPRHRVYVSPGEFRPFMHDKNADRVPHLACEDPDSATCVDRVNAGYPEWEYFSTTLGHHLQLVPLGR
jgi:hypothetical protein